MNGLTDPDFIKMLEEVFGKETSIRALEALSTDPSVSVRYNPLKLSDSLPGEIVEWSRWGRFLDHRPVFTLDPLFHAGCYYVQDSSAMFVGELSRHCMASIDVKDRPVRVLDLCAAPGGKTTDLAASLRERYGNNFILVANEVMRQRSTILDDNVSLWGDPNVIVTSVDPKAFAGLGPFFDMIVADVPCSGEGMFRKDAQAVKEWSVQTVDLCQGRQRRIVADVWPALSEGGVLVYSTCTFNRMENDNNVEWITSELGAELLKTDLSYEGVIRTGLGYSLVPGMVRGEGQYAAAVIKTSGRKPYTQKSKVKPVAIQADRSIADLFDCPVRLSLKADLVIAVPEVIADDAQALSGLRPIRTGVAVGTLKGKTLVPEADLALCSALSENAFPRYEVDRATALAFLHRDTFVLHDAPKGFVLICFEGHPLGFVKNLGNRCNNLHPASRRIRMDVDKQN